MRQRKKLIRGVVLMAMFGLLAGALGSTPGMALTKPDKKQVKKIARKIAKKVVNKALSDGDGGGGACPSGTQRYGEGCIEEDARANAQWFAAADECGDDNRRMATLAELQGFRTETGITLAGDEWSSDVHFDSILYGILMDEAGNTSELDASSLSQYRCVAPLV
ncbi:MAG: hypothetical protein ACRDJP_08275 [Actinomycetota bacterium]